MKFAVVLAAVLAVAMALPTPGDPKDDTVLRYDADVQPDGYKFGYEISDGTVREETGELKNAGTDEASISVRGSITWIAADGEKYTLKYVADENGYQPEAAHLPTLG